MYGGKSERLHTPEKRRKPVEPTEEVKAVPYVEDCQADFRKEVKGLKVDGTASQNLTNDGDTAIANGDKAKDPKQQSEQWRDGVDRYRQALVKDPYNHEATLKLALAYDKVYRKGCAIQMLRRLAQLAGQTYNSKWARDAQKDIDDVYDHTNWFRGYRKEAMTAVGR